MSFKEALPIIAPILVINLILMIVVIADLVRREPQRVRGPKWLWAVLSLNILGAILYLVFGRKD